jgi:hypothetical protein
MKAFLIVAACGLATAVGCQVSKDHHVDTDHRPAAQMDTSAYAMAYEATQDTQWAASTDANAARGTIARGDHVMFMRAPDASSSWQQARLSDGTVRYVHPADFRAVATTR